MGKRNEVGHSKAARVVVPALQPPEPRAGKTASRYLKARRNQGKARRASRMFVTRCVNRARNARPNGGHPVAREMAMTLLAPLVQARGVVVEITPALARLLLTWRLLRASPGQAMLTRKG